MFPQGFKAKGAALFMFRGDMWVTCSLRFTSGVTPADLLASSMAAELISYTYLESRYWWGPKVESIVLQTLPTELYRFRLINQIFI